MIFVQNVRRSVSRGAYVSCSLALEEVAMMLLQHMVEVPRPSIQMVVAVLAQYPGNEQILSTV